MNVLFLSLLDFNSFDERNIYSDLLREFIKNGHNVYCISPVERKNKQNTKIIHFGKSCILKLKIGNTQKVNFIEKGISTLLIEPLFINGIKRYFSDVKFDLVLYATPPVTFAKVIQFVKKRDNAKSYLMLKDIFPQNSVDLEILSTSGLKGILYKYFRNKEKVLYSISDKIGCMSEANVDYILKNNKDINKEKVEICPNAINPIDISISKDEKKHIRKKYNLPIDKLIFVYGGNLGKPQGIPFLIECLKMCSKINDLFFLIIGDGTEYNKIQAFINQSNLSNVKLMKSLPKEKYDAIVSACDVGMIFLDYRFTIPNFPSRILNYMEAKIPILAVTDANTDVGTTIVNGDFGWWCKSDDIVSVYNCIDKICNENLLAKGNNGFTYLVKNYNVKQSYKAIIKIIGDAYGKDCNN